MPSVPSPWARVVAAVISETQTSTKIQFANGDSMKSFFKFAGAALFLMSVPLLRADSVLFNVTTSGHSFSFSLPSQRLPDQSGKDFENIPFFFYNNIAVTVDGVTTNQGVVFFDTGDQFVDIGNEWFVNPQDQVVANNFFEGFFEEAQKMFSGPATNPTFIPGSQNGFFIGSGQENEPAATLDITTVAQTPEPGTFLLLSSGLLGLAGALRDKQAKQEPTRDRQRIDEFGYPGRLR
jgi:hypothetical protein